MKCSPFGLPVDLVFRKHDILTGEDDTGTFRGGYKMIGRGELHS